MEPFKALNKFQSRGQYSLNIQVMCIIKNAKPCGGKCMVRNNFMYVLHERRYDFTGKIRDVFFFFLGWKYGKPWRGWEVHVMKMKDHYLQTH